jgi:hypothetical protein
VRWSDGSFLYRRTWPETVSTLTPDLMGYCPAQATLKPVAGEAAGPEAMIGTRQTSEPQAPDVPGDVPRMTVEQLISERPATQAESLLAAPNPYAKDVT